MRSIYLTVPVLAFLLVAGSSLASQTNPPQRPDEPGLHQQSDSASMDEIRTFARRLLLPLYEEEWQRAVTAPNPNWTYALHLHLRLVQSEQDDL